MQVKDTSKFRFGPKYFGPTSGRECCYPPVVVGEVVVRFQGEPPSTDRHRCGLYQHSLPPVGALV